MLVCVEYKNDMDEKKKLQNKLDSLKAQLQKLETEGAEKIRQKRILADMGDDFRENEGAKLVMEDHNMLHLRTFNLKKEILETKKLILSCGNDRVRDREN